ncbi:hypothetical protein Tco_1391325 [Tanacetum coccineum]
MTSLTKCMALKESVGDCEWADMMELSCRKSWKLCAVSLRPVKTAEVSDDVLWTDERGCKANKCDSVCAYCCCNKGGKNRSSYSLSLSVGKFTTGLRLAREINALCARVTAIVDQREMFVDELDMLVGRHVPDKMADFMKEIQGKDIPNLMKLQILGREFELRAQEKGIFIEKLKGNLDY